MERRLETKEAVQERNQRESFQLHSMLNQFHGRRPYVYTIGNIIETINITKITTIKPTEEIETRKGEDEQEVVEGGTIIIIATTMPLN